MATTVARDRNAPLRILHVMRAPVGGLFRHVQDLIGAQVAAGHQVGLIADSTTGGARSDAVLHDLAPSLALGLHRLAMQRPPHVSDVPTAMRIARLEGAMAPDVVHGHGSKGGLFARLPGLLGFRSPVRAYTPHGGSLNQDNSLLRGRLYMAAERMLMRSTDVFLFESAFIGKRFHARVGHPFGLESVVCNGIGPDEFIPVAPRPDACDFVYVGELRAAKGIDTLLDALAILKKQGERPRSLVLVGSGPDETMLRARAASLGLSDHVSFAGLQPARSAFAMGRVLVVPSRAESLPYIVLEAAGAQIPIVATNVGGIPEIFGPYSDRLIAAESPRDLADRLILVGDADPDARAAEAAELASFVASRFSIAEMADTVVAGYRDAIARRVRSGLQRSGPSISTLSTDAS